MSDEPQNIRCTELEQWLADGRPCTILDVRTEPEWTARHIPGATLVPLHELEARVDEVLDLAGPLVVHCEHGVRSLSAAYFLISRGRRDIFNVIEGLSAWRGPTA